ncbi:hypothetical protein HNQ80_003246 [Anaerosolibacter carboniphilus]|uniref:Uncharacterized protein n=1 Tax=Anaerosolibacter carboniphilus TaxID=1417629 RepID=A0A841KYU4_9FIRM|nr:hypothetical protein [Anaerosolibacter carboniphilus]
MNELVAKKIEDEVREIYKKSRLLLHFWWEGTKCFRILVRYIYKILVAILNI